LCRSVRPVRSVVEGTEWAALESARWFKKFRMLRTERKAQSCEAAAERILGCVRFSAVEEPPRSGGLMEGICDCREIGAGD
jgi:hypothetical protein